MKISQCATTSMLQALVFALLAAASAPHAAAQRAPLACQIEASGGLSWREGRWNVARFEERRFILVQEGTSFTTESVAKALQANTAECTTVYANRISCIDGLGGYMLYDPQTNRGTIAQLLGGTTAGSARKDSLHVEPFVCTAF
jgi:hypothetical protein